MAVFDPYQGAVADLLWFRGDHTPYFLLCLCPYKNRVGILRKGPSLGTLTAYHKSDEDDEGTCTWEY